ncbi:MAG: hypothetical protein N2447_01950 [Thermoanaerobaculum sp.]|nr:hypothetical protein [Thermoanaerobaculum sp.]
MAGNLLDELLLLCRAAAEAGEDWRQRLRRQWLPQLLARQEEELRQGLWQWKGSAPENPEALEEAVVAALDEAMDEAGYL